MAEIDTSIYRTQQQPNALTQFGQLASTMNALNQNRLFQQQFNANLATSDAVKQATDPNTGQFDPKRATAIMSQGPAAYNVPQFMQQMQQQQQSQVGLETSQFDLANKRLGALRGALGSLLSNPNVSGKDVIAATSQLVSQGIATPKMAADVLASLPQDPKQLKVWLTDHLVNTMGAQEKLNAAYGTPQMQPGVDANGAPVVNPIAVSPIAGIRRLPVDAGQQGPGAAPAAPTQPSGSIQTGLAPGQKENMESSAKAYQTLRDEVGGSAQRVFQLNEALRGLQGSNTGPGTKFRNTLESYVMALPGAQSIGLVDEKGVVNYDKAAKYLSQIAASQPGAMGSDAKLAISQIANPSTEISNKAAQDIVKSLVGFERAKQAQAEIFGKSGALPGQFSDWAVQWNKNIDPRAFALDMMAPADRAKLVSGLKGNERRRFLDSVKLALSTGVIDPASFSAPPAQPVKQ